jgi:hypothetical protein
MVPEFACSEEDQDVYWRFLEEVEALGISGGEDPQKLPMCAQMVSKVCRYFELVAQDCTVSLTVRRQGKETAVFQSQAGPSTRLGCTAHLCFGDVGDLHFEGSGPRGAMHLPCGNGHLVLAASDVDLEWLPASQSQSQFTCGGQFLITVFGPSGLLREEAVLAPKLIPECKNAHVIRQSTQAGQSRPTMRIMTVRPSLRYVRPVSHDDVIVVPDFFCAENDLHVYYQLLKEMREAQSNGDRGTEWLSWHEGAHLLSKAPNGSRTYQQVLERLRQYFAIENNDEQGTRFNWYRDGSDWKPFHHDSAAFNPQRAALQNCTVGISFGASRELAFRHAKTGELVYFPQRNGMLFFFGRDVNIRWQHAINALPLEKQDGQGRISIILWGLCTKTFEEAGSPAMLDSGSRGPNRFAGGRSAGAGANYQQQVCRNFQQRGTCSFGDRCRYSHSLGPGGRKW